MTEPNGRASKIMMVIVAMIAWLGLAIQFYVTQSHPNLQTISPLQRTFRFLEYFTILTNLLVALSLTISLLLPSTSIGRFLSRTSVKTAVAVYIALVGIVYNLVLQGLNEFSGLAWIADFLTHDIVPLLYTAYWLLFVRGTGLGWSSPILWTMYPLLYVLYTLISAASTGRYPYPFLNVANLGLPSVLFNTLILSIVFVVLGEIFVAAAKIKSGDWRRTAASDT